MYQNINALLKAGGLCRGIGLGLGTVPRRSLWRRSLLRRRLGRPLLSLRTGSLRVLRRPGLLLLLLIGVLRRDGSFVLELLHSLLMSLIQLLPLSIHNDKAFSALLNTYPHLGHAIEIAPDAPLHSGPFHTVAETALDRFDVAVVSAVPLGQPLLPLMEIDGDSAQLGLSIFIRI